MQFWNFLAVRLLQAVMVVVSLVFLVSRLVGNPEQFLAGPDATREDFEGIKERFGPNDSIGVQYLNLLGDLIQGDLGHSWVGGGVSTLDSIGDRAWNTFKLGVAALAFALVTAVPLGVLAGLRRGRVSDWLARTLAVVGQAVPGFWLGLMMIFFFAVDLRWFPTGGAEGWRTLVLPEISLGMLEMAAIMRLTRSGMIEVMDTHFIRTARAKGLPERTVIVRHGLRHAMLPVATILGIGIGRLIAGSVIIEVVFA